MKRLSLISPVSMPGTGIIAGTDPPTQVKSEDTEIDPYF